MTNHIKLTNKGRQAHARVTGAYQRCIDTGYTPSNAGDKVRWVLCADLPAGLVNLALDSREPDELELRQLRQQGYAEVTP